MDLRESLLLIYRPEQLRFAEPMAAHTTMRVGGPADAFVCPDTPEQLKAALLLDAPKLVLGNGSNLIVRDGGFRGVVICTASLNKIRADGASLCAQAGALLPGLAAEALKRGLSGLEFASGIPGSVGGAVAMNAGAYGDCIADVLTRARVWMDGQDRWLSKEELDMGYRHTRVLAQKGVVLEAEFRLTPGEPAQIKARMDALNAQRRAKQPLDKPSAGSTFKRPEGHFAGALIERAGLKGLTVGRAQVSEKHAGFVVNLGGASAQDVLSLIALVQQNVMEHAGVALECEVQVIGES